MQAEEKLITIPVVLAIAVPASATEEEVVAFAADAVNEILREQQRSWFATSCLVDYQPKIDQIKENEAKPEGYTEGDAF